MCSSSARAPCSSSVLLRIQTNNKLSLIVARAGGGSNNSSTLSRIQTNNKPSRIVARAGGGGGGGGSSTLSRGNGNGTPTGPQPIDEPPLTADSYVCIGLATCFERDESSGKLTERLVVEPISASSLECMANGARTSFRYAAGTTLGALMRGGAGNNSSDALPAEYAGAALCANWARRVEAAARTWQRPHAQDHLMDIAPLPAKQAGGAGAAARPKARGGFNFSLDDKRVLNAVSVVTDADNVKQDISIDVYGRAEAEAKAREEEEGVEEGGGGGAPAGVADDAHARAEAVRAGLTAPCEHMGRPQDDDSSDDEDELDALLAA